MFGKKKTPKEQIRETKRDLSKNTRDLEREKNQLIRQEKQLIQDIKKEAQIGNQSGAKILAKQLVQLRSQKEKLFQMKASIGSLGMQVSAMGTQATMVNSIQQTTKVMTSMNKKMDTARMRETLMEFEKANHYMTHQEEMVQDSLIDAFDDEENEEAEQDILSQVLAEAGLDLHSLMSEAPINSLAQEEQKYQQAQIKAKEMSSLE